jgi:hypothetical protein
MRKASTACLSSAKSIFVRRLMCGSSSFTMAANACKPKQGRKQTWQQHQACYHCPTSPPVHQVHLQVSSNTLMDGSGMIHV